MSSVSKYIVTIIRFNAQKHCNEITDTLFRYGSLGEVQDDAWNFDRPTTGKWWLTIQTMAGVVVTSWSYCD